MLQVADAGVFILRSFMNEEQQLHCFEQCRKLYQTDEIMYNKHGSISNILKKIKTPHRGRFLLAFEPNRTKIEDYFNNLGQQVINHLYAQILQHKQCDLIIKTLPRPLPVNQQNKTNDDEKSATANDSNVDMKDSVHADDDHDKDNEDENTDAKQTDVHDNQWMSDRLNCVLYPLGSLLVRHVDNMDGWVILFSFGCDAKFYLQLLSNEKRQTGITINMKSGDVIVFEGGDQTRVLHGVDSIVDNSCPLYFKGKLWKGRIGLQLRQFIGIETHKI